MLAKLCYNKSDERGVKQFVNDLEYKGIQLRVRSVLTLIHSQL